MHALTSALLSSVQQYAERLNGKRVWLACSGGRDSLSLALVCRHLFDAGELPFLPQLLHVNHGMQKANSVWAQHVAQWAKQQQIPCTVLSVQLAQKTEQAARQARYEAMIQRMNHEDVLLLGHHQDDQVETVLMRLFNGAGVTGLGGMQPWRYQPAASTGSNTLSDCAALSESTDVPEKGIYLWRPWLTVSREQITEYAKAQQLAYIDDPTNKLEPSKRDNVAHLQASQQDALMPSDYTAKQITESNDRAWLRSVLMPLVGQRYPRAREAIARSSQLLQDASTIIEEQVQADLQRLCVAEEDYQAILNIDQLQVLSLPRQSATIHTWLAPAPDELPPSKRLVDDVIALSARCHTDHQTSLYWDSGVYQYQIRRYQNKLYRLRTQWLDWLQIPPDTQQLECASHHPLMIPNSLVLKSNPFESGLSVHWVLTGLHGVVHAWFHKDIHTDKSHPHAKPILDTSPQDNATLATPYLGAKSQTVTVQFEPLPRNLKVALMGRSGRKSGKKLLQALNLPSFMRQSVALCSIHVAAEDISLPLFIVTIDTIVPLQSPLADKIEAMVRNQQLNVTR